MGLFRQITDILPAQSASLGSTLRFTLPRDYPREGFIVKVAVTVGTAAATLNAERAAGLLRRVRLTANDGGQQRVIVDCDGLAILERAAHYGQLMDDDTATAFGSGTFAAATYTMSFPFYFAPPILGTPTNDLFLQNFPRFNTDPVLELQFATQAEMDSNATPTFALTGTATVYVIELKREVSAPNWRFLNTEFITQEKTYTSTVTDDRYQIPVPGFHTFVLMRPYTSVAALAGSIVTGNVRFQVLNTLQWNMPFADITRINQRSKPAPAGSAAADLLSGYLITAERAAIDFLSTKDETGITNLDTLLNTNPFSQLGTGPELRLNVTGDTDHKVVFLHERIFGDVSSALLLPSIVRR